MLVLEGLAGWTCEHCVTGGGYEEFLQPEPKKKEGFHSDVHVLWPTQVEVIPITTDIGGWEPPSFHKRLAQEAVRGWRTFQKKIIPKLPKNHHLRHQLAQKHAGALNDAFFHWQKRLFEEGGSVAGSLRESDRSPETPPPTANTSWPEMCASPEYNKLRAIVDRVSRRHLARSGVDAGVANGLNFSIFNWMAVHKPGEFHGPHTHVGEYNVGVFYAQAGSAAGKLRLGDPRGHSPPFGRTFFHTPRSGDLLIFPSWLSHMATVTAPSSDLAKEADAKEPLRVVFAFNIGPVTGPLPCHLWFSDPTSGTYFRRSSPFDPKQLGL